MVQYIKNGMAILLPYHCISLWPMYFQRGIFNMIDDEMLQDSKLLYTKWSLPIDTKRLMRYTRTINPQLYDRLSEKHVINVL